MNIRLIDSGINVSAIYWNLLSHPELWNQHTTRTESPDSPHYGLDDIWARFGGSDRAVDGAPHYAEWYPSADVLGIKALCLDVMRAVGGVELGGVLITRIPAGQECRPHTDDGWHALHYQKYAIQIASAPGQKFCFENEELETRPGDLFWFNNQSKHWVKNDTPYERVTMIICIRVEG